MGGVGGEMDTLMAVECACRDGDSGALGAAKVRIIPVKDRDTSVLTHIHTQDIQSRRFNLTLLEVRVWAASLSGPTAPKEPPLTILWAWMRKE